MGRLRCRASSDAARTRRFLQLTGQHAASALGLIAFFLLLAGAVRPVYGIFDGASIEVETLENEEIVVHFQKPLLETAKEIVRLYPLVKEYLAKALKWQIRFRPTVVLVKDNKTFGIFSENEMVVAFADPERQVIVIDCSRVGAHPFDLEATFKHELCHLLLHANIPAGLPRWFDEGVSQWVTGGLAEILMDRRRPSIGEAALAGKLLRFDSLSARFPEDRYGLTLAYEQSRSLVEYIAENYGAPRLLLLLTALKDGSTMDDAVRGNLGLSFRELERRWASHLSQRVTWLIYISNNLYEILFLFASLMTVIAAVRIIVRRFRSRPSEDAEGQE
jgi:hypothetical protein